MANGIKDQGTNKHGNTGRGKPYGESERLFATLVPGISSQQLLDSIVSVVETCSMSIQPEHATT